VGFNLNPGKKKGTFKAIKGKIDHVNSEGVWLVFPNYTESWLYQNAWLYKTQAEAERAKKTILEHKTL